MAWKIAGLGYWPLRRYMITKGYFDLTAEKSLEKIT